MGMPRFTLVSGNVIAVNSARVAYVEDMTSRVDIYFSGSESDSIAVRESFDAVYNALIR
jgi:hypothetical protein